jgi:hypothetical protein
MEAPMLDHGDAAGHYSNGVRAKPYRAETAEERATYHKWMRGIIAFYCALALATGLLAAVNYSGAGFTQITHLSERPVATSPRAD